ncbi:MAG TPA: carboxylesterase family protein [Terriglobales bacterium]|jgi:para-nitrobenzyl esterase|nr:carboxylesterase family protein [Terriglobales bacterium]
MKRFVEIWLGGLILLVGSLSAGAATDVVTVQQGKFQGTSNSNQEVRIFREIPFAAPPVGDLRWKAPQPAPSFAGVRQADKFGPACLQTNVFGDIYFRDALPSEDCLNLNIWVPAKPASKKLPVFLWYYGGGFVAGANSEPRYDGENLAKKGVIVVEPNYRLGVFGFFAHPELTKESGHNSSGNYGLLDQVAALQWVVKNIAAFGGDPQNITIGGESAGSLSVSGLMASPLSRDMFQKAIGESGAFFPGPTGGLSPRPLADAEQAGVKFAESLGATSLARLRAKPADELLQAAAKINRGFGFGATVDGYYLPTDIPNIYAQGSQSHVPLLAGWNADEGKMMVLFNPQKPTAKTFADKAHERFGDEADQFLKLYPAATDEEAVLSAQALAGDDFIAFSTWKWIDMQRKTGGSPVYQYHFEQVPKTKPGAMVGPILASEMGSKHAGEIEYVFQTLKSQEGVPWTDDDFKVSDAMSSYWVNFIKNGNPNGDGLPEWPASGASDGFQVMHLSGAKIYAGADRLRGRYEFLDARSSKTPVKQGGGSQ